jgi:hypothetical protein
VRALGYGGGAEVTKAAAVCSILLGLGFGMPGAYGAAYLAVHHQIWRFLGFPTYGEGPFTRWGVETSVPLLLAYVLLCAGEVGLGVWLWRGSSAALWAALAVLPFELVFWTGFALPFGFLLGLTRTVLVALALLGR